MTSPQSSPLQPGWGEPIAERDFWRTDALARLEMAVWLHRGVLQKGDEDRAAFVRVDTIYPTLAALREASAASWATDEERAVIAEAEAIQRGPADDVAPPDTAR